MGSPILQMRKPRHKLFVRSLPSCHKTKQSIRVSNSGLSRHRPGCFPPLRTDPSACTLPSSEADSQACHWLETVGEPCWGQRLQGLSTGSVLPLLLLLGCRPRWAHPPPTRQVLACVLRPFHSHLCCTLRDPQDLSSLNLSQNIIFQGHTANLERQGIRRQGNEPIVPHQRERAAPSSGPGAKVPGGDIFKQSISHY